MITNAHTTKEREELIQTAPIRLYKYKEFKNHAQAVAFKADCRDLLRGENKKIKK